MKIIVGRKEILESASLANFLVSAKTIEDIFKNIKIEAQEKSVSIYGTDRETILKYTVGEVEVEEKGTALIPAQKVVDVLTKVLDDKVTVISDKRGEGSGITITTERGNFKILGLPPEEFVEFPEVDWKDAVEVEPGALSDMVKKTVFAASPERTRYALNGIFVKFGEKRLEVVATDGKRLAKTERATGEKKEPSPGVIASLKCMHLLERICAMAQSAGETTVSLKVLENQICARTSNCVVVSRLVEGHYPDYESVIPKDCDKTLKIDVKEFVQLISEGAALGDRESQSVKFSFKSGKMTLSSRSANADEAKVEASVNYEGEDIEITFNPLYILEPLKAFEQVVIKFSFKESGSAAVLTVLPVEEEKPLGYTYVYVVMPLDIH
jgi:DNA polymerase-3 subunit beta